MSEQRDTSDPVPPRAADPNAPRVRTLLICDLADSTALVERLGDSPAAELIRRHDRVARDLLQRFRGREIDKTDGFLALFERPVEAVGFALHYQRALRQLGEDARQELRARVGIHVGEVVLWENTRAEIDSGAKPLEVEGLAKPVVARLMALALPGQVLLSGVAFTLAQRAERELDAGAGLRWLTHGRYHFKGVPAPMLVHEVGESGLAPLHAPPSGPKAQRDVPLWRRPGVLALEAIAVLAAVAIPSWLSLRAPPAIAFGERDWVVMGELRNLTGETLLDDSLETAFRISLEQSRHVNVLPDLKLRDALARMQRPPDTAIDRAVASEIALREGARAVILPTVAEVGGRVRVSAEVVDPHTQTTVYAESADGVGAVSALDSIDTVTHELRARLGEALAAIEQDSAPLPKVTSSNLDALRAYALGYKAYLEHADLPEAVRLYRQALTLDPGFAHAKLGLARVQLASENQVEARRLISDALVDRQRLPARERLYAEAFEAGLNYEEDHLDRWRALNSAYPDFFPSFYNFALYSYERDNEYHRAAEFARRGLDSRNPGLGALHYLLGLLELGQENFDAAASDLAKARALGGDASGWVWAQLHGAKRDYAAATEAVGSFRKSGFVANDVFATLTQAAVLADQGRVDEAATRLAEARLEARRIGPDHELVFAVAELSMRYFGMSAEEFSQAIRSLIETQLARPLGTEQTDGALAAAALSWAAAEASDQGDDVAAQRALSRARETMRGLHFPSVTQSIAAAEGVARCRADDCVGLAELAEQNADDLLILTRERVASALEQEKRFDDAIEVLKSLAASRGRAYAEPSGTHMFKPRNVVATNLALLRLAELQVWRDRSAARSALSDFLRAWPRERLPASLARRVEQVEERLQSH